MLDRAGISLTDKKVLVLGSGGASLTAQAAARRAGARKIVVVSRSGPDNYENLDRHQYSDVLINTTPIGMWPNMEGRPVDVWSLDVTAVADVIYNPGRTELLLQAEEIDRDFHRMSDAPRDVLVNAGLRPIRYTGGLPMLVQQAKRAEELFSGREIPDSETERILAGLWQERTNIVLVGMPGCGKTTVGRELARLSGKPLVDLDEEIVRRAGKPIPEIFRSEGEGAFRDLESRVLADACAQGGQIIATGGGVVLRKENCTAMRRTGRVYFLRRALSQLPTDGRPLSQRGDLAEMFRLREPLYQAVADAEIDNGTTPAGAAHWIWNEFCG